MHPDLTEQRHADDHADEERPARHRRKVEQMRGDERRGEAAAELADEARHVEQHHLTAVGIDLAREIVAASAEHLGGDGGRARARFGRRGQRGLRGDPSYNFV